MTDRLTQVTLTRPMRTEDGSLPDPTRVLHDVVWIEAGLAKVGRPVRSLEDDQVWWVKEVYGSHEVEDLNKQYSVWRQFKEVLDRGGH